MTEKTCHAWLVGENTPEKRTSWLSGMTGATLLDVLQHTQFFSCIASSSRAGAMVGKGTQAQDYQPVGRNVALLQTNPPAVVLSGCVSSPSLRVDQV